MIVAESIQELREHLYSLRMQGKSIAFVPTMGALHKGHLSLINLAQKNADIVVLSIYVNPTQFLPGEDLDKYPKTLSTDLAASEEVGVDLVFTPTSEDIYPAPPKLQIHVSELAEYMCGKSRPGHFEGVLQIVNKLFNLVRPDIAVFGQKDYQQFRLIEQMVHEFNHPIQLIMAPIIRDFDGLALSSRNRYLNPKERNKALALYEAIRKTKDSIYSSLSFDIDSAKSRIEESGLQIDYFNVYSVSNLQPVQQISRGSKYVIAGAVFCGKTRLIDNELITL